MKLEFVLLADAVENVNGKLYVMGGGWRQFNSASFPAVARIGIAVSVLAEPGDLPGPHQVHVRLCKAGFDPNTTLAQLPPGIMVGVLDVHAQIQLAQPITARQRNFVAFNGAFPLPQDGSYEITATLDDEGPMTIDFEARIVVPASQTLN